MYNKTVEREGNEIQNVLYYNLGSSYVVNVLHVNFTESGLNRAKQRASKTRIQSTRFTKERRAEINSIKHYYSGYQARFGCKQNFM